MSTQKSLARSQAIVADRNPAGLKAVEGAQEGNMAYYRLLAERLEVLLRDIDETLVPSDDDLVQRDVIQRLERLLSEARRHLAKGA